MANNICALLQKWSPEKDQLDWVLATVIKTEGSSYRKPGAMMLINGLGQYFGLVSGGCLESDLMRQARRCWLNGEQRVVHYDMSDQEELAWKIGIGCGGVIDILLQPVSAENHYLQLDILLDRVCHNKTAHYWQSLNQQKPQNFCTDSEQNPFSENSRQECEAFHSVQAPMPQIAIFGGGADAKPLAQIAETLGWQILLFDPRVGYAKKADFPKDTVIVREAYDTLLPEQDLSDCQAAVIMNHNVSLDAQALSLLHGSSVSYIGLLGPMHRSERVLTEANLTVASLSHRLFTPIGLDLGGELPESIALSVMAQIHAHIHGRDGKVLSSVTPSELCLQATG